MSEYHLIKTDTLREIENLAHELKGISDDLEIDEYANRIILFCNEPIECNVKPGCSV